jgi:hypothetical protein
VISGATFLVRSAACAPLTRSDAARVDTSVVMISASIETWSASSGWLATVGKLGHDDLSSLGKDRRVVKPRHQGRYPYGRPKSDARRRWTVLWVIAVGLVVLVAVLVLAVIGAVSLLSSP